MTDDKTAEQLRDCRKSFEETAAPQGYSMVRKGEGYRSNVTALAWEWFARGWQIDNLNTRADSGEAVAVSDTPEYSYGYQQAIEDGLLQINPCPHAAPSVSPSKTVEVKFTHPRATAVDVRALAFAAIEAETELPDDMPDEMWLHLHDDRDAVTEALRITVRQTKKSIRERLQAAIASRNGS